MHITRMDELGPEIRKARKALGLSQTDLALATGLSIKFLSQLETGKADNPSFANILDITRALGGQVMLDWSDMASEPDPDQTDGDRA
ncbi:helix-turn-helix domain-containing protein [Thalassospira sp. UBA1131]|uniref:helix-turn-helix domain-containing protein n=1 Tax=Thalassospira sp. UBA1131 TaxID=1947672 RepID=UPI0025F11D4E|nr:helix-turn-helix transcriptional regulator [Thalassospira sp. UBA1131]